MKSKKYWSYRIGMCLAIIAPQFILFLSRDAERQGISLYLNNYYTLAILIGMWFPGFAVALTIERRMDKIEKLLEDNLQKGKRDQNV